MKNKDNVLNIAFSLGSIIDIKKSSQVFREEGMEAFRAILKKHKDKNSIFDPGPSLGLFMALRKLNRLIPDDVLKIEFGLVSRIDPNPDIQSVIMDSMKYYLDENKEDGQVIYDNGFDMIALTGGEDIVPFLGKEVFNTDIYFTTSKESATELYNHGLNTVCIPNKDKDNNIELYKKRHGNIVLFTDYDGVISDASSERIYQNALKQEGVDPIAAFMEHEELNKDIPMELGPLGNTIRKLSRVVKYQMNKNITQKEALLNIIVVTARQGQAYDRCNMTIDFNGVSISQLYMMKGQNKNHILNALGKLNKGKNLLFFDDSEIHFKRSSQLTDFSSGWVPNELINEKYENKKKD